MNFVTDVQKEKYIGNLKIVQDLVIQFEKCEKQLDDDDLSEFSDNNLKENAKLNQQDD